MSLFRKRAPPIMVVTDEEVYFVTRDPTGRGAISDPVPVDRILRDEVDLQPIARSFRRQGPPVMIVPDYWLGNAVFPFQSKRRCLAEAFLERKLTGDFPDLPGLKNFFAYFFYQTPAGETMLYAYFLREPRFYSLYDRLAGWHLEPARITAPAYLWESRLKGRVPAFERGGTAFLHVLTRECNLYFFYEGHFLFSRQIRLPSEGGDVSAQLDVLAYETNQSLYLFSQKTKAEIDRVYMASFGMVEPGAFGERLGRPVEPFTSLEEELAEESVTIGHPGLLSGIFLPDLSRMRDFSSISHRELEREQQWRPVQKVGIAVGLALLLLLAGEGVLLWRWSRPVSLEPASGKGVEATEAVRVLREYEEALDLFLKETRRPSAANAIIQVARSLPENVWIKELAVETEPDPGIHITGTVRAARPEEFREALTRLLENLGSAFQGARSLGLQDVEFDAEKCRTEEGYRACDVGVRFPLP